MSSAMIMKLFFIVLMSLVLAFIVFSRNDHEIGSELYDNQRRYLPYISGQVLPIYLITLICLFIVYGRLEQAANIIISLYFNLFIHISLFYTILIFLLPTLRKYIRARSIAFLWMLPNLLYYIFNSLFIPEKPLIVINFPQIIFKIVFVIIFTGTLIVLVWNIVSHLKYRNFILNDSKEITDVNVLNIWENELKIANIKKAKFKLVISKNVSTPLTIGLFKRTMKVVLPHLNYTEEELIFIFRHEIIHIGREDVWSKFFLIFCTSLCWYNPLMWIAKRKCSEDLELSCDETVLIDMDDGQRKKYANLILNTAANQQGFTTCLSASATALQYRLTNIIKPKKKYTGAIIVGIAFFLMFISCGFVSLAYDKTTGSEVIFNNQNSTDYSISNIIIYDDPYNHEIECVDEEGFHQYLSNLQLSKLTGNYTFENEDELRYTTVYNTPNGVMQLVISEEALQVVSYKGEKRYETNYYILDSINWNEFEKYIKIYPTLKFEIKYDGNSYFDNVDALLMQVEKDNNTIYEETIVEDQNIGICGSRLPVLAKLNFSSETVLDYWIEIHSWDYNQSYTINQKAINETGEFPLPDYSAHYFIYATLEDEDGEIVDAKFLVNIGDSSCLVPEE